MKNRASAPPAAIKGFADTQAIAESSTPEELAAILEDEINGAAPDDGYADATYGDVAAIFAAF